MSDPNPSSQSLSQMSSERLTRLQKPSSDLPIAIVRNRLASESQTGKLGFNDVTEQSEDGSKVVKTIPSILKKPVDENARQAEWELIISSPDGNQPSSAVTSDAGGSGTPPRSPEKLDCPECCPDSDDDDLVPAMNRSEVFVF